MSFSIEFAEDTQEYRARIKDVGVGGSGGNAVNTMINFGLEGVDFITLLDRSAVTGGKDFQNAVAKMNVNLTSLNADTRRWIDSQMKSRFDDANANGQSPVSPEVASVWLRGLIASLPPSAT